MNTSNSPPQRDDLEARLASLTAVDPVAAEQIRVHLDDALWPDAPADVDPGRAVDLWLAELPGLPTPDRVIVLGCGTADEMQALMDRLPPAVKVLLLEYDLPRVAQLFRTWRFEEAVATGRLVPAMGRDNAYILARFSGLVDMQRPPSTRIYDGHVASPEAAAFYLDVLRNIKTGMHLNIFNLNTLLDHGPLWQFNSLKNLPHLVLHPGIETLFNRFTGKPALIVGAGPSLNDALPFIKQAAAGYVVLATATSLRALRRAGIRPDLVVAVDASRKTAGQFTVACEDLYLACSSIVYPPAIPKFRGIFSGQLDASPIDRWLCARGNRKGSWVAAGTVTTTAVDLAIRMGCGPIVSVGFDLSFSEDGTTHASHTMYHGARLDPRKLVLVPGNYRAEVLTTEQFRVYITLLEGYLETRQGIRFVNATAGGARIRGMELQSPSALCGFAQTGLDAFSVISEVHTAYQPVNVEGIADDLEDTAARFNDLILDAHRAAMLCNRLIMMVRRPRGGDEPEAYDLLKEMEAIDRRFAEARDASLLLDMSLWPISFASGAFDRTKAEERLSEAVLANRRSRDLYEQIAGAAKWTRLLLVEVLEAIRRRGGDRAAWCGAPEDACAERLQAV